MQASESPVIYSTSVRTAQAVKLTTEQRAALAAKADRFRARRRMDPAQLVSVSVPVIDPSTGAVIGDITYKF